MTTNAFGQPEIFEPLPSEEILIRDVISAMNRKYAGKKNSQAELVALADETDNRLRAIGFKAHIDISNVELSSNGLDYSSPIVEVYGRVTPQTEVDHSRLQDEVRSGLADGKVGKIKSDGTFSNETAKSSFWVPGSNS